MKLARVQAIEIVARADVAAMTVDERAERLDVIGLEGWDRDPIWLGMARDLRRELQRAELREEPTSARYDEALLMTVLPRYAGAVNAYLVERLRALGVEVGQIVGEPVQLEACPCCGRRTLSDRAVYDICRVCWWEDDGQDNADADKVLGGPNGKLSLTDARRNFLVHGIYDPGREDLRAHQDPPEMYARERVFTVDDDGVVSESADG